MSALEQQAEELEVLESIYGADEEFHKISATSFQYKFGKDGERVSFLLEITWPEPYPEVIPSYNLNAFYNNHLSKQTKAKILNEICQESEKMIGEIQTYNILEWTRTEFERLGSSYITEVEGQDDGDSDPSEESRTQLEETNKTKVKKEQLTKAQKRREWAKKDNKGETTRGANWVDLVKHLSQTGGQND